MKKAKRALALALVFALVASFCVTGAAAEPGQGDIVYGSYDNGNWTQAPDGDGSYTDSTSGVKVSKTAVATSAENQYEVTLKVEVPVTTSTKSASAATVLVIDVSNSMYYCDQCGREDEHKWDCKYNGPGGRDDDVEYNQTRLHAAKEAAKEFVNGYRDTKNNTPRYVAIVSFGEEGHNVSHYWYDVSTDNGYKAVIDAINGLDTPQGDDGGTNLDGGLSKAEALFKLNDIIDDVPKENRFAIALTDGKPTYSDNYPWTSGMSCNQDILDDTQETANGLKKEAKLYTVCFGAAEEVCWEGSWYQEKGPTVGDFLKNSIASSGCAYEANDGDALNNIFNQLTEDIEDSLERLTVTDPMADGVMLNTDFTDDSVSVVNDDTITWGLNNGERDGNTITYTLTYTVTVDPDKFEGQEEGYYPLNGQTFLTIPAQDEGDTESTVQFPVPGVFVTPTVTENSGSITIQVYVDGSPVEINNEENFATYISGLQNGENTANWSQDYSDGKIVGTYSYDTYDSADIVLTPNSNYVLQGIEGTFIQGSQAWQGITQSDDGWKIDNVKGGSTLKVYLNTKYSVEYVVTGSETIKAPTDDAVYVTGAGVTSENMANVDNNDGAPRSWKNNGLTTKFTIANVPEGATGWTDEANDSQTAGTEITVSTAVTNGLDDNSDHIFTFSATANEYTVTYHANTSADDPTLYTDSNTVTHGESYTVLGNTNDYFQYTNTGYTFAGWATSATGGVAYSAGSNITVTEDVDLYAVWTAITGTLTVTKTVEGLVGDDTLPSDFSITVTGPDGSSQTLTLNGKTPVDGVYTWEIIDAPYGEYTITETNANVSGYALQESSVTEAKAEINDESGDTAELKNVYVKDNPGLDVVKTVYSVGDATGENIPEKVKVGDVIVYQIVVKNTGNVALENISVKDELAGQLYSDPSCADTDEVDGTISSLAVGGSATFYAKYEVTAADAEDGSVTNKATAESGDTTGTDSETVEVKKQYTLTVEYYYDEASGEPFKTEECTLNEGDSWSVSTETTDATHVAPEKVENDEGIQYVLDTALPITSDADGIKEDTVVELVYARDEWEDGTPDYKQARIVYEVAGDSTGMGSVSPESRVVTLTDEADGIYKGTVKAESTAMPEDGNVFVSWSGNGYSPEVQTNVLSHEFTAEGGKEYVYTASFRAGKTDAEVTKTLVSYTRDDVTVDKIPADFKARVGDVLNYKITVKNKGELSLTTTVRDTIDGKGTLTINPGTGYTVENGVITVNALAPNATVTISASYTVVAGDIGQTITNTATVDLQGGDDPKDDEKVTVDDYSVTITPADIVAYTGGDGYSAVVGADDEYINNSTSGLPEPGYHVVLSDAVVDWLNDNGVAAGDGLTDDATDLADVLSFTYDDGTNKRNWSLRYVGVYSYNASGNPSAYVYSIVTETAGAPSVSLKYFDDLNEDGVAGDNEVITSDDILMSANQVNRTYKMTIEGGGLDQRQVKAVLQAGGKSLTTDIEIGIGELTVLSTTNEETTNSIADSAAGVDSGVITAVGNDSITYYVNESGVAFDDEDLVSRVQLLIDEVTNETSGEFETAMAEAAFDAVSADLRNAEYEMCYMDLVDTENGNAKVTFSGGELSIYWPLPDGASASDSFYIVHFTELDREHAAVGTDVLDTTNKDVIAGEVMRIGGEYYVTFDVGSFSPFVLVYGDEGGDEPWWPPIGPGDDGDEGDDGGDGEFVPKWLNIDDHYAYIIGYEDGTVRPQGNITRAEVATIFFRLLTDEVREEYWSTVSGYTDVKAGDWYNNAISTLSNLGVITGYEDGTFRPNASISRAEFVTIATRFFDYTAEYEGTFSDVSYLSWYADFVQAAVDMGLVNGYENGTFRPNASITRAEAVAIVNRVLLRRPDADHLLPWSVMNTFSDNVLESAWYYEDIQEATNSHDYEWLKSGVEDWTEKLPERDWAALEREWSSAYDAPGGEVTG